MVAYPTLSQDEHGTQLALVPSIQPQMLMPVVTPQGAKEAVAAYEAMKSAMIRPGDVVETNGGQFLRKPYWMRIARAFGLRVENVSEERLDLDGRVAYRVINRAIAPNGQSMDGDGFFIEGEKKEANEHNIRARAFTRATNRAISNLVGGGEVSAEELPEEHEARRSSRPQARQARVVEEKAQAPAKTRKWATLAAQARKAGIYETQEQWEVYVARICSVPLDFKDWNNTHYDAVEQAIADKEAENRAAAEEAGEDGYDLHDLNVPGARH